MVKRRAWILVLAALVAVVAGYTLAPAVGDLATRLLVGPTARPAARPGDQEYPVPHERTDGLHYTLVDEQGQIVLQTGHFVVVGDEYVAADNEHYRVTAIHGDRCTVTRIGAFSLDPVADQPALATPGAYPEPDARPAAAPQSATVGVYHTHGDESYVSGDGTSSRPVGGVVDVGKELVSTMEEEGIKVQHDANRHAPHDSGAYRRSRRTATALMRKGSGTLLDVHRDSAPRSAYATEVDGEPASKVMLVVGRANPQMQTTLNFVRSFKRVLDEAHPGLVRGIYFGRGGYNQDLSPRAVLLEMGSHRTPKDHAVRTAGLIGAAMPDILGVAGTPAAGAGRTSWANLGWLVVVVVLGAAGYLVYANGGLRAAWSSLRGFARREFASALLPPDDPANREGHRPEPEDPTKRRPDDRRPDDR